MPISFLLTWRTIPSLVLHFLCLLDFRVTQTRKGEKERGASNKGSFGNKNKHNISPMIILLMPVSLTLSTASKYLNSSSSTNLHLLHRYHCNTVAAPPLPQQKRPLPKSNTIAAAVLWPLLIENQIFFSQKIISLSNRGQVGRPSMC